MRAPIIILLLLPAVVAAAGDCATMTINLTGTIEPGHGIGVPLTFPAPGSVEAEMANVTLVVSNGSIVASGFGYLQASLAPGNYTIGVYNTGSAPQTVSGRLTLKLCGDGGLAAWLSYIAYIRNTVLGPAAPVGIAVYGVGKGKEGWTATAIETNAVLGIIVPRKVDDIFDVQLNAYVAVELADGSIQYYWVQNIIEFNGTPSIWDNMWNVTTYPSVLTSITGNGEVLPATQGNYYGYTYGSIPLGPTALTITAGVDKGKAVVDFYVDDVDYDTVEIAPYLPAKKVWIYTAPAMTPTGFPLDLELVVGGPYGYTPFATITDSEVELSLYVKEGGKWVVPGPAWSVGGSTHEVAVASVSAINDTAVLVGPGSPQVTQLWSITQPAMPVIPHLATQEIIAVFTSKYGILFFVGIALIAVSTWADRRDRRKRKRLYYRR